MFILKGVAIEPRASSMAPRHCPFRRPGQSGVWCAQPVCRLLVALCAAAALQVRLRVVYSASGAAGARQLLDEMLTRDRMREGERLPHGR